MTEPLIDVTGHRQSRIRARRVRWLRRLGVVLVGAALAGLVVWVFYGSSLLAVRDVTVTGNRLVTTEQVLAAAEVAEGTPLAVVDDRAVASRVGALPAVAGVRVERKWPTTLIVSITERSVRLVIARGDGFDWVDATGVVFHHAPERPDGTMLVEADADDDKVLAGIVTVANALPAQVLSRATTIAASSADSIVVKLDDGSRVVWGSAESSDLKAQVIGPLLEVKAGVYDVSSPTHPTTRAS